MSLHKHFKNRENGDKFCCFCCGAEGSARKHDRFMVRGHAPATRQQQEPQTFRRKVKKNHMPEFEQ